MREPLRSAPGAAAEGRGVAFERAAEFAAELIRVAPRIPLAEGVAGSHAPSRVVAS
jgi:hypothetical protein